MSIWGKIIGGFAGFAFGGPLGALLGAYAGHAFDKTRGGGGGGRGRSDDEAIDKQVAFTIAVIVLSAKMAKADGHVSRDEVEAFKRIFHIPPDEMKNVGQIFDDARQDAKGFEVYAKQIAGMFAHEPAVLEELLGGLFHIAKADGVIHPAELDFLKKVAATFGFSRRRFERIRVSHMGPEKADPFKVLGLTRKASNDEIKSTYRKLTRENHPDKLIAQGVPQEFIDLANEKMAVINAAYDRIEKERGLR